MTFTEILAALDKGEAVAVAATLAGLSITAASFLTNIAKTQKEATETAKEAQKAAKADLEKARDEKKAPYQAVLSDKTEKYEAERLISEATSRTMRRLIWAFFCFIVYLIDCLSLDAIAEPGALISINDLVLTYPNLLMIDVAVSAISFGLGVALLGWSGKAMLDLVPETDPASKGTGNQ